MTTERDIRNQIEFARNEGMEKGIEKGIEKGKLDTAKNLKELGVDKSIISKATGLTEEVVAGLKI